MGQKGQNVSFILCVKLITSFVLTFLSSATWVGACLPGPLICSWIGNSQRAALLMVSCTQWLHMAAIWNSISSDKSLCFPSLAKPAQIRLLQIQFQYELYFLSFLEFHSYGRLPEAGNSLNFCQRKLKKKIKNTPEPIICSFPCSPSSSLHANWLNSFVLPACFSFLSLVSLKPSISHGCCRAHSVVVISLSLFSSPQLILSGCPTTNTWAFSVGGCWH